MTSIKDPEKSFGQTLFKYRGVIPLAPLLLTFYLVSWQATNHSFDIYPFGWLTVCFVISIIGELIRVITVGYSPKGTSGRNTEFQVADVLVTDGIYSMVRNPLYLANSVIWIGITACTQNVTFIVFTAVFITWFYFKIIQTEERYLTEKFGEQYLIWKNQTPTIFPNIKAYCKSSRNWNWRKVLRKEKNGIAAILGIYSMLACISTLSESDMSWSTFMKNHPFYAGLGFLGVFLYLIIKSLMRWSRLLENK